MIGGQRLNWQKIIVGDSKQAWLMTSDKLTAAAAAATASDTKTRCIISMIRLLSTIIVLQPGKSITQLYRVLRKEKPDIMRFSDETKR